MSKHALIIHGTMGSPDGNWFPWLDRMLSAQGMTVHRPAFPTPDGQTVDAWCAVAQATLAGIDPADTIIIGHSIGAACALHLAEKTAAPFHAVIAVCPFLCLLGFAEYDRLNASFVTHAFDWDKAKRGAKQFILLAGDNDPYVPLPAAQDVADKLETALHVITGGGHLNAESGYTRFNDLLALLPQ